MAKYLHVSFHFTAKDVEHKILEPVFNEVGKDWIRYAPNCWIVFADGTPEEWANRLLKVIGPGNSVLVVEWTNGFGYMSQFFWEWYRRDRSKL